MADPNPHPVERTELLAQSEWMRALARRLVYDPQEVDDVVQDAWVALIRKPPLRTVPLRRWLAIVIRNTARQRGRGESRRKRREQDAVPAAPAPATDDVVARAESHRAVVAAVLGLAEPYRTTVLLRFYDRLPPRAIAARMRCGTATVHTRLRRALAQLRGELDRAGGGDGKRWLALLAPLLLARPAAAAASLTTAAALVGAAAVALAAIGVGFWSVRDHAPAARSARTLPAEAAADAVPPDPAQPSPQPPADLLAGRVVDGEDRPLAGAGIWTLPGDASPGLGSIAPLEPIERAWDAFRAQSFSDPSTRTDDDGHFRIAPGTGSLFVSLPGYETALVRTPHDRETVVLKRRLVVRGVVVTPDGEPLADATVDLVGGATYRMAAPLRLAQTRTDAEGRFSFPDQPAASAVWVRHPDHPELFYRLWDSLLSDLAKDPGLWPRVEMHAWASLRGTVVRKEDGAPVAGACVHAAEFMSCAPPHFTRTDARGAFALRYGRSKQPTVLVVDAGDAGSAVVNLRADQESAHVEIGASGTVEGRVEGGDLEGALVYALQEAAPVRSGRVQADGTFSIAGLRADARFWLLLDPEHPEWEETRAIETLNPTGVDALPPLRDSAHPTDVVLRVQRKRTLRGRVETPDGNPVRGARFEIPSGTAMVLDRAVALAWMPYALDAPQPDEQGRFVWRGVTARVERVRLPVSAPGYVNRVHVLANDENDVVIVLEPGRELLGSVRFEDGSPAAGVTVFAYAKQARRSDDPVYPDERVHERVVTDDSGAFAFRSLSPETFHLFVRPPQGWLAPPTQAKQPGEGPVLFTLRKGSPLRVVVRDEAGRPLPGATVALARANRNVADERADATGEVRIDALESGVYQGQVWLEDYLAQVQTPVTIPASGPWEVTLRRGFAITGRVLTENGDPVPTILVAAQRTSGAEGFAGRYVERYTDAEGRFRLGGLSAGRFRVQVRTLVPTTDQVFDPQEEVEAGTTIEIRGRAGRFITGTVRAPGGELDDVCMVEAFPAAGEPDRRDPGTPIQCSTDQHGAFRIGPLPKGRWDLLAYSRDRTLCTTHWDVEAGKQGVDLALGGDRVVRGRVFDGKDEPADANVYVAPADRPRVQILIFAQARRNDGRFTIAGLPPGPLRVEVVDPRTQKWGVRGDPIDPGSDEELTLRLKDQ